MIVLYNAAGKPEKIDEAIFGAMPADALALKYSDAVSDAEWITDETRLAELRREDAPLAYTERPEALTVESIEQKLEEVRQLANTGDDEGAHGAQDELLLSVLAAIAGGAPNPGELAATALKVDEIKFSRWYA